MAVAYPAMRRSPHWGPRGPHDISSVAAPDVDLMSMFRSGRLAFALALATAPLLLRAQSQGPTSAPPPTQTQSMPESPASASPMPGAKPAAEQPGGTGLVVCGQPFPRPSRQPAAGARPVIVAIAPCFEKQGGAPVV